MLAHLLSDFLNLEEVVYCVLDASLKEKSSRMSFREMSIVKDSIYFMRIFSTYVEKKFERKTFISVMKFFPFPETAHDALTSCCRAKSLCLGQNWSALAPQLDSTPVVGSNPSIVQLLKKSFRKLLNAFLFLTAKNRVFFDKKKRIFRLISGTLFSRKISAFQRY